MPTFNEPVIVNHRLVAKYFDPPDESIGNEAIKTGTVVDADKLETKLRLFHTQGLGVTNADDATGKIVHVMETAGTLRSAKGMNNGALVGDATMEIDVQVNGVSVLAAPIELTSALAAREQLAGVIADADLAVGDVITVHYDATVGTGTLGTGCTTLIQIDQHPTT